ncbi:SUMF1/EgtB/PvdO family nonheme iron enzyme, partial [Winogradskyella sp.]|uniref:SUMF1/EgtB/PvdO family nonheme iron enzyme n=1 Tax=Winogradskyella sp. TaxID=1883156 RepID=UPI00351707D2
MKTKVFSLFLFCLMCQCLMFGQTEDMALIEGSRYIPLYGRDSTVVEVKDFKMDKYPVTVEDFELFVKENPKWRKSNAIKLFTDKSYLSNWKNDLESNDSIKSKSPITHVSWFAAKAYCECQNKSCNMYQAALTFNKRDLLSVLKPYGIKSAPSFYLNKGDIINEENILEVVGLPCFVKPNKSGSSFGISKVKSKEELLSAIDIAYKEDDEIIIEGFLDGIE